MAHKINISYKGKTYNAEAEPDVLAGKSLGEIIDGKLIKPELEGYQLEITGGSDFSGFPLSKNVEGIGIKRVLLKKGGFGLHKRPKGIRKRVPQSHGLRMRKTLRGKTISEKTIQINTKVLGPGKNPLEKIFPEQNQTKAPEQSTGKKEKGLEKSRSDTKEKAKQIAEETAELVPQVLSSPH